MSDTSKRLTTVIGDLKPATVTITNQSILEIEQIALRYFFEDMQTIRPRMMFKALHHWLIQKGLKPQFEVEIESNDRYKIG